MSTVDVLRGLAALAVTWFHLTNGAPGFLPDGFLKRSGAHGWLGVDVFFVISGFVIPYALFRARYRLSDYGRFIAKRLVRLDPPYLAAIALVLAVGFVSAHLPGYRGGPFSIAWTPLLLHLGYANAFFDYSWLNPVFWTLAVEFQYYLLIGLAFPVLTARSVRLQLTAIVLMAVAAWLVPAERFVCHWLFVFLWGVLIFQERAGLISRRRLIVGFMLNAIAVSLTHGVVVAAVTSVTAVLVAFVTIPAPAPLRWLGGLSYSLYLVHVPIGGRAINLADRLQLSPSAKIGAVLAALAASLLAAEVLHRAVEAPAMRWSSKIRYRRDTAAPPEVGAAASSAVTAS